MPAHFFLAMAVECGKMEAKKPNPGHTVILNKYKYAIWGPVELFLNYKHPIRVTDLSS